MNNLTKYIFSLVILIITYISVHAQTDPQYTANTFNKLGLNPAYAGTSGRMNVSGIIRNQWMSVQSAKDKTFDPYGSYDVNLPETMFFNIEGKFNILKKENGIGISFMLDNFCLISLQYINAIYSYKHKFGKHKLSFGINPGAVNLIWDGSKAYIPEKSDYFTGISISEIKASDNDTKFDMGFGIFYEYGKFYSGFSASHLFLPELTISQYGHYLFLNRTYTLLAGLSYLWPGNKDYRLEPSLVIKSDLVSFKTSQVDLGCNLWYKEVMFGGMNFRIEDAVSFLVGFNLKNGLLVGSAVDVTTSHLHYRSWGGVEIFLNYAFDLSLEKRKDKYKSIRIL